MNTTTYNASVKEPVPATAGQAAAATPSASTPPPAVQAAALPTPAPLGAGESAGPSAFKRLLKTWPVRISLLILLAIVAMAVFAPWLGTDGFGRDVYSRVVYGARVSLVVGAGVVLISVTLGLIIGIAAGYFRLADAIIMRVMDGMMAIPGILLAIALVALSGATLATVLIAISVPEIPRVVRMVRSVILGVRNESYVEAATSLGTRLPAMVWRHMMPNTLAPLLVQGTYIFASAIMTEAVLSFLGAGIPPETPSWGNLMADGRTFFLLMPGIILYPGVLVSLTVLSVNMLGDALRDGLDPRMAKRL